MKDAPDDKLRHVLHEWSDVPAPDAGLAAQVLRDVGAKARGQRATGGGFIPFRFALAGMALGLLVGVTAVEWRKSRAEAAMAAEMPQRYAAWIAPTAAAKDFRP